MSITSNLLLWSTLVAGMMTDATAFALPRAGTAAPAARVQTLDPIVLDLRALRGKIALVFYEDKDSTSQNKVLKDALERQGKSPGHKPNVVVYAVADVSSYNWWPARGFVEDALRKHEAKSKTPIYADWTGTFGKTLGVRRGVSNLVLIDPDNKVILSHSGTVPPPMQERILLELRK